jgi:hypothetical protein
MLRITHTASEKKIRALIERDLGQTRVWPLSSKKARSPPVGKKDPTDITIAKHSDPQSISDRSDLFF